MARSRSAGASTFKVFDTDGTELWSNTAYDPTDPSMSCAIFDFDGDGSFDPPSPPVVEYTYYTAGTYVAALRVTDDDGHCLESTTTVTVESIVTPVAVLSANPTNPRVGEVVRFDASGSSDSDGTIVTYAYDFEGDGSFDSGPSVVEHTYATAGTYTAVLRVTDNDGLSHETTTTLAVGSCGACGAGEVCVNGDCVLEPNCDYTPTDSSEFCMEHGAGRPGDVVTMELFIQGSSECPELEQSSTNINLPGLTTEECCPVVETPGLFTLANPGFGPLLGVSGATGEGCVNRWTLNERYHAEQPHWRGIPWFRVHAFTDGAINMCPERIPSGTSVPIEIRIEAGTPPGDYELVFDVNSGVEPYEGYHPSQIYGPAYDEPCNSNRAKNGILRVLAP